MSNRQRIILDILQDGPATAFSLAQNLGAPIASVRRDVIHLRQQGWFINDARDYNGMYRLVPQVGV